MKKVVYKTAYESPMGMLTLASDGTSLIGLWIEGQHYFADSVRGEMTEHADLAVFEEVKTWLDRYFDGQNPDVSGLKLTPVGTEFRKTVWNILREIPYGETRTYGEIAAQIAAQRGTKTMSAQAVGGAVGHNPISIIIPCHRVMGADGSLTGYAGGVDKKRFLLELEGIKL